MRLLWTSAVKARGKAMRRLLDKGKAKVTASVTYVPRGGDPSTRSRSIVLKRRSSAARR